MNNISRPHSLFNFCRRFEQYLQHENSFIMLLPLVSKNKFLTKAFIFLLILLVTFRFKNLISKQLVDTRRPFFDS